jgi:hypothetical protein
MSGIASGEVGRGESKVVTERSQPSESGGLDPADCPALRQRASWPQGGAL